MNKTILYIALIIGLVFSSCKTTENTVDSSKDVSSQKMIDKPLAKSLLWEISGNGLAESSYLFGTIHIIDADKYFLPAGTLEAIDKSDIMVFEIDIKEMEDMSAMFEIMMSAFMDDGVTIKDLVSDEDYQLISNHFSEMGVPFMMLERIKPMFLSMMGGDIDMDAMQTGEMVSYELKFGEIAESSGKATAGLESIEFQMGLFDSIPYEAQAEMLVETIKTGGGDDSQFEQLMEQYLTQDVDAMATYISEESEDMQNFEELLLVKRNENWIPQIAKLSAESKAFYAVGAGHLGGPKGVIRLLMEEGFTVTPIIKE